jgi:starch synthase
MEPGGVGIRFDHMYFDDMMHAVWRAFDLYHKTDIRNACVRNAMQKDFSWDSSAGKYIAVYNSLSLR